MHSTTLGLLSLVSAAAAVPHYGAHSRFHSRFTASGGYSGPATGTHLPPYPSGGPKNGTVPGPTGNGGAVSSGEETTTIVDTSYSAETIVSTIYATRSPAAGGNGASSSYVGVNDVSSGAGAGAGGCGSATVYVTATNKVTVTVPAGGGPATSAAPASAGQPSSPAAAPSSAGQPSSPAAAPSSSEQPSSEAAPVASTTAQASLPGSVYQAATSSPAAEEALSSFSLANKQPVASVPASSAAPVQSYAASSPASSAAQPTSSSSSGGGSGSPNYSGKKPGLAYNTASLLSKFDNGEFGFAYNWASTETEKLPSGVQFVPMMHKTQDATPSEFLANVDKAYEAGTRVIMAFNEPERGDQANITPELACSPWGDYIAEAAKAHPDMTILAPSVTNGNMSKVEQGSAIGLEWLEQFKAHCPDAVSLYSGINLHYYDTWEQENLSAGNLGTIGRFKQHYKDAVKQNPGKQVWVTEMNLNDDGKANEDAAAEFLSAVKSFLDGEETCAGYAWFMVGSGKFQLLGSDGSLSKAGSKYVTS